VVIAAKIGQTPLAKQAAEFARFVRWASGASGQNVLLRAVVEARSGHKTLVVAGPMPSTQSRSNAIHRLVTQGRHASCLDLIQ